MFEHLPPNEPLLVGNFSDKNTEEEKGSFLHEADTQRWESEGLTWEVNS